MNIQKAVRMAIKNDGMICRASTMMGDGGIYGAVKPTNTYDACLLVVLSGERVKKAVGIGILQQMI